MIQMRFLEGNESDGLGIPYPKGSVPESGNVGYFDLKKFPEKIEEIPEISNWLEFKEFLAIVNRADSFFRTLRCDVFVTDVNDPKAPKVKKRVFSYVTIAFEILGINTARGNFDVFREKFKKFADVYQQQIDACFHLMHIPTSYNDHGINRAWSQDVYIEGFGESEKDAKKMWASGLQLLLAFLVSENRLSSNANELKKGRTTIS